MIGGETPYTAAEEKKLHQLLDAAIADDPGEEYEAAYLREFKAEQPVKPHDRNSSLQ